MATNFPDTTKINSDTGSTWADGDKFVDNSSGLTYYWYDPVWKAETGQPIYIQPETPDSPNNGDIWIDLNECPPELKIWSNCSGTGQWETIEGGTPPIPPITFDVSITDSGADGNVVGQTLTAVAANIAGGTAPVEFGYQWYADGAPEAEPEGAQKTKIILATDVGKTITCDITVAEPDGSDAVTKTATYAEIPELGASINKPVVLTPPDGAGIGGETTYYPVTSEVTSTVDPSLFCGASRPLSDNSLFSGVVWVGDRYLVNGSDPPYTILESTDGKTWTTVSTGFPGGELGARAGQMFYNSVTNRVYAFTTSNIIFSDNKGVSLTSWGPNSSLAAAQVRATEKILAFCADGRIFLMDSSNPDPTLVHSTAPWPASGSVTLAEHVVDDTYLVVSRGPRPNYTYSLHRTTDGGANWSTPTGITAGLTMRAMGADGAGNALLFAYSSDGTIKGVYKSTDNGASFSEATLPKEVDAINHLYYTNGWFYAVYETSIFRTKNLGESWENCGNTQMNSAAIYAHNGFFIVETAGGSGGQIAWSSDGVTFVASGLILELTNSTVYSSIDSQPVSLTLEEAFQAGEFVQVSGTSGNATTVKSIEGTTMRIVSDIGVNAGDQMEGLEALTEFGPDADVVEFTSSTPAGTAITTYGQATWQVDTDVNFSSPMTATKAITVGSNQELLPSERGAITLSSDTTYNVRVKYDAADPSGVESVYSDVNQFKTAVVTTKWNESICANSNWNSITWGNNLYVALSGAGRVQYSQTGLSNTWTDLDPNPVPVFSFSGEDIAFGNNRFVAIGHYMYGRFYLGSTDGITWEMLTDDISETKRPTCIKYINGEFIGVGLGIVAISTTGAYLSFTHTPLTGVADSIQLTGLAYGNNTYVTVSSTDVLYSSDKFNWSSGTFPSRAFTDVAFGAGLFVVVGNIIMTSADGINWTERVDIQSDQKQLLEITYSNGKFTAVGYAYGDDPNAIYTSTDGITWNKGIAPSPDPYNSIVYGADKYVAVGNNIAMWSSDGAVRAGQFYSYDNIKNKATNDLEVIDRYGVDPTADNTSLGIYELTEQPTGAVAAYVPNGDKYNPVIDLSQPLEQAQAEAAQANARLNEANVTIETMRSNFETRIAALELANVTTYNYDVTVVNTGYGNKYFIDGNQQPTLNVNSGDTLVFDQSDSSNTGHPLRIYEDEARTTEVSSGVTVDGTTITYVPSTTGTYYYQCQAHAGMGGQITVS